MSPETEGLGPPELNHISVVVKDLDETAEFLSSTLGIVFHETFRNLVYDKALAVGKPHRLHSIHAKLGPSKIGFELLQPLDEDCVLGQFLKTKGEGLHHIAFHVLNWNEIVPKLIVRGSKILQGGISTHSRDLIRFFHGETGSGGIIIELGELKVEGGVVVEAGYIGDSELGETKEVGAKISPATDVLSLPDPDRISAVVKDIDETAEFLSSTLGIGPWRISRNLVYKKMTVGKPFSLHAAHAQLSGPVELELLQPLEEESLWGQFLKTKGEGLHHIAFNLSNWDEVVSKLKERATMVVGGVNPYGKRWCCFETKPGGILIEFDEK